MPCAILTGLRERYEAHHKVRIPDESIQAAVRLSARYIGDRLLPDKALDLLDEAASKVSLAAFEAPEQTGVDGGPAQAAAGGEKTPL